MSSMASTNLKPKRLFDRKKLYQYEVSDGYIEDWGRGEDDAISSSWTTNSINIRLPDVNIGNFITK